MVKKLVMKKYSSPENGVLQYDFSPFIRFLKKENFS